MQQTNQQQQQQQLLIGNNKKLLLKRDTLKLLPPLNLGRLNDELDNSIILSSKSTYLDNASFIGGTGGGGGSTSSSGSNNNILINDKNTIHKSIVFSLQDSIPT